MANRDILNINRVASYLKVPTGKIGVNNEMVCIETQHNPKITTIYITFLYR